MIDTLGNFRQEGETTEYLVMSFVSANLSLQDRWRNNSLSADFLANYWGTFFWADEEASSPLQAEIKDAVNYIANELLENAIKFHYESNDHPVKIGIYLLEHALRFYVTNSVDPDTVPSFRHYIQTLLANDPGELFLQQLERNAADEDNTESHLGLLTILNDYQAHVAWRFETIPTEPATILVTTMVELPVVRIK